MPASGSGGKGVKGGVKGLKGVRSMASHKVQAARLRTLCDMVAGEARPGTLPPVGASAMSMLCFFWTTRKSKAQEDPKTL